MPYVRRKTDNVLVRLDTYYQSIMALKFGIGVGEDGQPLRATDQQEALQKEVFGDRIIEAAPDSWYQAESFLSAEMLPHQWLAVPFESRARWLAAKRVESMIKGLERYREVIDRKNRDAQSKLKSKKTGRGSRR